jgi:NADH:ubiquinone oxidoreductase subunit F (NADH-binding)
MSRKDRLGAAALKAEAETRAGCVRLSYCRRGTGPMIGVYKSDEAGMESDPETPWSVVCEEHNTIVCTFTRAEAMSTASDSRNFCDDCRELAPPEGT